MPLTRGGGLHLQGVMRCGRGLRTTHYIVQPRLTIYATKICSFSLITNSIDRTKSENSIIIKNQRMTLKLIILCCLTAILGAGFLVMIIRNQLKRSAAEKERYADMYESTLAERDALSEMLETQTVSEETRTIITQRLEILNTIITHTFRKGMRT